MINVTKASGEIVPFDAEKIRHSLRRVNTDPALIEQIVEASREIAMRFRLQNYTGSFRS